MTGVPRPPRTTDGSFAFVAFTIGMCYQVSGTALRDPQIRRTVLAHTILSYASGVVIAAGSVSLLSGVGLGPPVSETMWQDPRALAADRGTAAAGEAAAAAELSGVIGACGEYRLVFSSARAA